MRLVASQRALAWNPYNVTEDADLGIRLARFGLRVGTIASTTWEEAPPSYRIWLGQRTRWLKGWMQTYIVHMRRPRRLLRELGWWAFAGLQMLMAAMIDSTVVYPWFYVLMRHTAYNGLCFPIQPWPATRRFGGLRCPISMGLFVRCIGWDACRVVAWTARDRRAHAAGAVYCLAISLAVFRALGELVTAPFHWEKMRHCARVRRSKC